MATLNLDLVNANDHAGHGDEQDSNEMVYDSIEMQELDEYEEEEGFKTERLPPHSLHKNSTLATTLLAPSVSGDFSEIRELKHTSSMPMLVEDSSEE